jgi:sugar lactone lactonase YvrE
MAGPYSFGRPTDVAWDAAGNIFISDGYTNSRVVKYDKSGRFIKSVGERGTQPLQMNTPHSIQVDAQGNVYVADRGNQRIQVLNNDLTLKTIYDNVGAPWSVCITPGPHQYLYSSNSNPDNNNSIQAAVTGEIYKMELDGRVLGKFGVSGKQLKEFSTVHAIDCRVDNQLLVGEITSWRVQKLMLKPPTTTTSSR